MAPLLLDLFVVLDYLLDLQVFLSFLRFCILLILKDLLCLLKLVDDILNQKRLPVHVLLVASGCMQLSEVFFCLCELLMFLLKFGDL